MRRMNTIWIALLGAIVVAVPASSQESRPTPRPTPTPAATPRPGSLAELARRIRLQRPEGKSTITISNHNLAELGRGAHLTTASRPSTPPGGEGTVTPTEGGEEGAPPSGPEAKREYWRERYREQLKKVEEIRRRIQELDREIPRLWSQFYSWDDPAYRDGVIKPKLDQALSERERLAKQLPEEEAKLPQIMDEARRDGALPGWFRNLDRD